MEDLNLYNKLSHEILGAAIEVHKELGPGLLESVYETCLIEELVSRGLSVQSQMELPIIYKNKNLDKHFVIDLLVEDRMVVELKAVEELKKVHEVQLLTYLKLANKKMGLLINFNVPVLKDGVRRRLNGLLK